MKQQNIEFCNNCSSDILKEWQGWPNRDVIPILPKLKNGKCQTCGSNEVLLSNTIRWANIGPGLPDHWELKVNSEYSEFYLKWGLPYYAITTCPRCKSEAVISQHPQNTENEFKINCPACGLRKYKDNQSNKLEPTLVGVAGEYLVAGELTLRGYIASITLRNSRGIDIIASNSDGSKSISIQVKTNSHGLKSWILNKKSEEFFSNNHYYVFVALNKLNERPFFHVVPSKIVAEYIKTNHANWLEGRTRDGKKRKDTPMRKFNDPEGNYLEMWNLIKL